MCRHLCLKRTQFFSDILTFFQIIIVRKQKQQELCSSCHSLTLQQLELPSEDNVLLLSHQMHSEDTKNPS